MNTQGIDTPKEQFAGTSRFLPEESFYEKERKRLEATPFTMPYDEHDYKYPLENWGNYCDHNRELRREHYITSYQSLDNIRKNAIMTTMINSENGKKTEIILLKGAIEQLEIDAIVNAANETLLGGGGVDQAIHTGAGPMLVKECANRFHEGCEVGDAKITKGYRLPAKYVIHTVGPLLQGGEQPDPEALKNCYINSLELCETQRIQSVAFPCISCGFYGFPVDLSARVVSECIKQKAEGHVRHLDVVVLVVFDDVQSREYANALKNIYKIT